MHDPRVKDGDYIMNFGQDTPENRAEAEKILRNNGCRSFVMEHAVAGHLIAHGFLTRPVDEFYG